MAYSNSTAKHQHHGPMHTEVVIDPVSGKVHKAEALNAVTEPLD